MDPVSITNKHLPESECKGIVKTHYGDAVHYNCNGSPIYVLIEGCEEDEIESRAVIALDDYKQSEKFNIGEVKQKFPSHDHPLPLILVCSNDN